MYRLALLNAKKGDYIRAVSLYQKALAISKSVFGEEHPEYGQIAHGLAVTYHSLGEYEKAEQFLREAVSTIRNIGGRANEANYSAALRSLSDLYLSMERYKDAMTYAKESLELSEKQMSERPLDYASSLSTIGHVFYAMHEYSAADANFTKSLKIRRQQLGDVHLDVAQSLQGLSAVSYSTKDYGRAKRLLVESLQIEQSLLGDRHWQLALTHHNLALICSKQELVDQSFLQFTRAHEIILAHIDRLSSSLSEQQQLSIVRAQRFQLDHFVDAYSNTSDLQLAQVLLWKGAVISRMRRLRVAYDDPTIAVSLKGLRSLAAQISALTQQIPSPSQVDQWKDRLAKLTTEKEQLESEMMRKSAAYAKANKPVTLKDIQRAIPEDGALVDYLEFHGKNGRALVASVVFPDSEPKLVFLGSAQELGAQIDRWRKSYGEDTPSQQAGVELRKQIWEPLLPLIGDAKTILVSTDGDLGRLPLAALPGKEAGKYLIEEHRLVMIPVPQLLPELMESNSPSDLPRGLLAMGAIDYNADPKSVPEGQPAESETKKNLDSLAIRTRSDLPAGVRGNSKWDQLDATGPEVDFVTKLYSQKHNSPDSAIVKLDRSTASEASFRALATGSKFIHLATHGFFADPDKKSALSSEMVAQSAQDEMFSLGDKHKIIRGHNPGQLSGLVFAGANRPAPVMTIDNLTENHGENDGILTADEIAFLRLEGCELVVLSACQTGLGATAGGEGILGLQRSFQLAGARSVVSSLWNVNDEATNQLMQLFYTNVWTQKMSKLDALRNAQLDMLNFYDPDTHKLSTNTTRADRSQPIEMKLVPKKDPKNSNITNRSHRLSPKYWAAFQLSGDWR